jgi:diguanylate cyclase (GGDEF)-like protein/PAS domain S-box-containing protein
MSVDPCVRELEKAQYTVEAVAIATLAQCTEELRSQSFDLVVAEYPSLHWNGSQDLKLLHQTMLEIPLLFLITESGTEPMEGLTSHGAFDYLERAHVAQLPMVVRRILNERRLSAELVEAERALEHSRSQYRALLENPSYGVLSCDAEGRFLDVNDALVGMLGYATKEEVLEASRASRIFLDIEKGVPVAVESTENILIEPAEVAWKRKNGTILRANLSGRGVRARDGQFMRYDLIVVDITEQRELENRLRREASSDPLTGLANRRSLFESLSAEIDRSKRTQREFCFILLDVDRLKEINDRFGHLTGDRALCRLANILQDCSRSLDTAARQGGDEFALVLPETGAGPAGLVASRICAFLGKDREEPPLSVSYGIACFPANGDSIGTLIRAADVALYAMKRNRSKITITARSST